MEAVEKFRNIEKLYTIAEVSKFLQMNYWTLYNHLREGSLHCVKLGRLIRIKESQLKDWIEEHTDEDIKGWEVAESMDSEGVILHNPKYETELG